MLGKETPQYVGLPKEDGQEIERHGKTVKTVNSS